ncbi:hypothetical protein ACN47E_000736 [Coniothyrium glycines]
MNNMVIYVASDHPQKIDNPGAKGRNSHIENFRNFGPPPRNTWVSRMRTQKGDILYADHTVDGTTVGSARRDGASYYHPFSPDGLLEGKQPLIQPEFVDDRQKSGGFFFPPLKYQPDTFVWNRYDTWAAALAAQFAARFEVEITEDTIMSRYKELADDGNAKQDREKYLYHPADRGTAIFGGEAEAALVARHYDPEKPFSLCIASPHTPEDGVGWERIWHVTNRPPIRIRWSIGDQSMYPIVLLGCIPKPITKTGREDVFKEVFWFSLEPKRGLVSEKILDLMHYGPAEGIVMLWRSFGLDFESPNPFWWTLVMLHRSVALGVNIPDSQLGNWMQQYAKHLGRCTTPHTLPEFMFDRTRAYNGKQITYDELTALVLHSKTARNYAKPWDAAAEALIEYNIYRDNGTYEKFKTAMKAARTASW